MASYADVYRERHRALFDGWTCIVPWQGTGQPGTLVDPRQVMSVAVFWPDQPIPLRYGSPCRALWFGHVRSDIAVGRVAAGDRIATSWDSGIRFESRSILARASHVHTCGSISGTLTPNGEVDGYLVAELLGWTLRPTGIPGPTDYLSGGYLAGKRKEDWGHHPVPALPE